MLNITQAFGTWNIRFSTISSVLYQIQEPMLHHKFIAPEFIFKSAYR